MGTLEKLGERPKRAIMKNDIRIMCIYSVQQVFRKKWIEIVRNVNICGYQMKVMLKKMGHIVEIVKNAVKKEVYMWKKTDLFNKHI